MKKGTVFIVSAPPGAGKTSLTTHIVQALQQEFNLSKIITYTTRKPRQNEKQDIDYHFITHAEFEQKNKALFFLETNEYNGNLYGSPKSLLDDLEQGKSFFLVVDRSGAQKIKTLIKNPVLIWLTVPNVEALQLRMQNRGTDNQEELVERMVIACKEIQDETRDPAFKYHVYNENFEQAANEIIGIIRKEFASRG